MENVPSWSAHRNYGPKESIISIMFKSSMKHCLRRDESWRVDEIIESMLGLVLQEPKRSLDNV